MGHAWVGLVVAASFLAVTSCGSSTGEPSDAGAKGAINNGDDTAAGGDVGGAEADGNGTNADEPVDGDDVGNDGPQTVVPHVPLLHRASAAACTQPRPAGQAGNCSGFADAGTCSSDQDCSTGADGRCVCRLSPVVSNNSPYCSYDDCATDSDCKGGGVCDCRESPAHSIWTTQTVCLYGNCRTDSDCGQGGYCSPSPEPGCGAQSWYGYYCHTPGDQCIDDTDCSEANAYCAYDGASSRWVCSTGMCQDG